MAKKQTALDKAKKQLEEQGRTIADLRMEIENLEKKTKIVDFIIDAVVQSKELNDLIQEEVGVAIDDVRLSR